MEYDRRGQKKTEQDEAPSCLLIFLNEKTWSGANVPTENIKKKNYK